MCWKLKFELDAKSNFVPDSQPDQKGRPWEFEHSTAQQQQR